MTEHIEVHKGAEKCANCGRPKSQHNTGAGVPMCPVITCFRTEPPASQVSPELVERMVAAIRLHLSCDGNAEPEFRALMAELEPPVDPLVAACANLRAAPRRDEMTDEEHAAYLRAMITKLGHSITISKEG